MGFPRPQGWDLQSVKVLLRFQHSPALVPSRSNLTVRVNDTAVGRVPLNRPQSQIAQVLVCDPIHKLFSRLTLILSSKLLISGSSCDDNREIWWYKQFRLASRLLCPCPPNLLNRVQGPVNRC
ncbi:cellulose biosynthesis cyclic di-GMP-binding regulatory protein BcsB [Trichothermofontia sichuanensis]|uniref:cellulose biosynthesis cyclic di-GMP-binding regulatory protein BcsB n=1 Tax=Trichothermofontia sichuanensis TaxID=3045816 RepID=UPI0036F41788